MMWRALLALCLFAPLCSAAEPDLPAKDDLLFYASFDKSTRADVSRGAAKPTEVRGSGTAEGVSGAAIRFHKEDGVAECAFAAEGCINDKEGTVALHFRPNWSGSDFKIRMFFSFPGPKNKGGGPNTAASLTLYTFRYKQPVQQLWLWIDDAGGGNNIAKTGIDDWEKGQWHHLAATWKTGLMEIYIDGELKARKRLKGVIGTPGETFYIGSGPRGRDNTDGIVDEVCIYGRALTASEIGLLTGRPEFTTPHVHSLKPKQSVFYTSEKWIPFECEAGGKLSADTHELRIELVAADGKIVAKATEEPRMPAYFLQADVAAEGDYMLRVSLRDKVSGKVLDTKEAALRFIDGPFAASR